MQKKHTGWMAIISILVLCISVMAKQPLLAAQPLSIALCLDHDVMKQGEEMKVSVALQNYDDSYKDNVITTMIVEVSVNTDQLSVNEDTIQVDLDEGKGMAFSMAKLKGSNVELQYLNVSDPLKKGTKDLYSFTVTAQTDIEDLKKCLNISYVAVQDGSKAESEKLTAVPVVMVANKAMEQETIEEKYTSEYGTVQSEEKDVSNAVSEIEKSQGSTGNSENTDNSSNSNNSNNSSNSTNNSNSSNNNGNNSNSSNDNSNNSGSDSSGSGEDSKTQESKGSNSANNPTEKKSDSKEESSQNTEKDTVKDTEEENQKATSESKSETGTTENEKSSKSGHGSVVAVAVILVCVVLAAAGVYFVRKKKK
ncbi:MAG: hypothetical protein ACLR6A_03520 [Candidatus Gastranaerophilaceae bacterium]